MKITRKSPLTGKNATKEINVTAAQIAAWENGEWPTSAFPDASPSELEFITLGYTDSDWNEMFREFDDDA